MLTGEIPNMSKAGAGYARTVDSGRQLRNREVLQAEIVPSIYSVLVVLARNEKVSHNNEALKIVRTAWNLITGPTSR